MISVIPTQRSEFRTFGWVQDPGNLRSLCDVVAVFDPNSPKHRELTETVIPALVEARDGRDRLLAALQARPLQIPYSDLAGTAFFPRRTSRCNGIIQATVKGQGCDFIGDWPANNFVRWAHCFGFIRYSYENDAFEITEQGLELTAARPAEGEALSGRECELLTAAALAYPPAIRILTLLSESEDTHLTKFELGACLGFIGEDGFTSLPQTVFVRSLATAALQDRKTMKANWEGSSDKYARMIAGWLEKLGLVQRLPKRVTVSLGGMQYSETIGQAYVITAAGMTALRRANGGSRHRRIVKNLCWEMFCTKGADRAYIRTRRALILKLLSESRQALTVENIVEGLRDFRIEARDSTVADDIRGLINIGLRILPNEEGYRFDDVIADFVIPLSQELTSSDLTETKEALREQLTHLSHEYLSLIDLAYDSRQNRLFEIKTMELLTEACGYQGLHLGGGRRPDGIAYTLEAPKGYGIIVDTKAYSNGYSLPISQADEMERYIGENRARDGQLNRNRWWEHFDGALEDFYFLFVSGHFIGNCQAQLDRIERSKSILGAAVPIAELLLLTEQYQAGILTHEAIKNRIFEAREREIVI